jgi:hypothetical protein
MSKLAETGPPDDLVAGREETKYLLPAAGAQAFAAALGQRLPHHRFTGHGANTLPRPRHFVTTIYFDTPSRHNLAELRRSRDLHMKLRAREYYDLHPSLAELATDPRQIVKYQPLLWLELKHKHGGRTGKRRIGIPKPQVPAFFREVRAGALTPELVARHAVLAGPATASDPGEGAAVLDEIAAFCRRFPEPLGADCLVHYRRLPWQDAEAGVRVTLDLGVEFFPPPDDLWRHRYALCRETLGRPRGQLDEAIVELKCRREVPAFLLELLERAGARPARLSKFESASAAVHGDG